MIDAYGVATKAMIAKTKALVDGETPLPETKGEFKSFPYTRILLEWVLNRGGVSKPDLARRCVDALVLLGIDHAVPEVKEWAREELAWQTRYLKVLRASRKENG